MALRKLKAQNEKNDLIKRAKEIDEELIKVQDDLSELIEKSKIIDETGTDEEKEHILELDDSLEDRKQKLQEEKAEINAKLQIVEDALKTFGEGEELTMAEKKVSTENIETRDALNAYFEARDREMEQVRAAGLTSTDAEVLIPVDVVYQPVDEIYTEQDLEQYINVVNVSTATGKYPVLLRTDEKMHTVEELNENPKLGNPKFRQVMWDVDTYRGSIPISQEAIDDSAIDMTGLVSKHILRIVLNTTNDKVSELIKLYRPAIAKSI